MSEGAHDRECGRHARSEARERQDSLARSVAVLAGEDGWMADLGLEASGEPARARTATPESIHQWQEKRDLQPAIAICVT